VIPSLTNNVFADVLRGVYDSSEGSRYSIQLANTRYSILQEEKLLHLFRAQKPAGLIVTGINQTAESRAILESMNCPVAQIMEIDNNPVDMMVGFSHYDAGFAAITHMLEQGFRRIGFLGARMDPRVQRRFEGYRDAMKAASLFDPNFVVTTSVPTTVTLGGTLFADLLARTPDIDAVFCVNDDLALGVLFECQRRQISVPGKIAIVGFNDLEFMAAAVPSLTSVRTNRYEMGRHAVTMVIDAIEGRRPQEPILDLGFQLMVRQSSLPQGA
jgi:LacI family gluconate utilization system Gnt-I transcriptional repressor